jgi:hypothetical protein
MPLLKQSTAASLIVGPILDSAGAEYASAVIGDISLSKNGATLTALASAATLTYISNGLYTLALTTGNTDTLGRAEIFCNKSTYQMPPVRLTVLSATTFDALITNAAGAANGIPICGSNAATTFATLTSTGAFTCGSTALGNTTMGTLATSGTTTLNALTVTNNTTLTGAVSMGTTFNISGNITFGSNLTITGTTTHTGNVVLSDGLTVSAPSTTNRAGITITGNGTGAGIISTGGATGNGVTFTGGAAGHGMLCAGLGSSKYGISATAAGLSGHAISAVAGNTGGDGAFFAAGTNAHGLELNGLGSGHGFYSFGGNTGNGATFTAGNTSGHGLACSGKGTSFSGIIATGSPTTGSGMSFVGGSTSGNAITTSATSGTTTIKSDIDTIKTNPVANGGTVTFPTDATLASTTGAVGSVTANVTADVVKWLGTAVSTPNVAGVPDVNTKTWNNLATVSLPLVPATPGRSLVVDAAGLADANMVKMGPTGAGIAQAARDIGTSVLLSSGTGTGQVSLVSGAVLLQATQTGVTIPTVTTVTGLTASDVGAIKTKTDFLPSITPGATNGLFIAGTNAATTITTALTTTFTGSLTGNVNGSVNSVTNRVTANVDQINANATAAVNLALSAGVIIPGTIATAGFSPTATEFEASDITEATTDHYKGRVILFTSGALLGQATSITAYSLVGGRGHFTVVGMTEAGANTDTFVIV